jgi:hypothetical protein
MLVYHMMSRRVKIACNAYLPFFLSASGLEIIELCVMVYVVLNWDCMENRWRIFIILFCSSPAILNRDCSPFTYVDYYSLFIYCSYLKKFTHSFSRRKSRNPSPQVTYDVDLRLPKARSGFGITCSAVDVLLHLGGTSPDSLIIHWHSPLLIIPRTMGGRIYIYVYIYI